MASRMGGGPKSSKARPRHAKTTRSVGLIGPREAEVVRGAVNFLSNAARRDFPLEEV